MHLIYGGFYTLLVLLMALVLLIVFGAVAGSPGAGAPAEGGIVLAVFVAVLAFYLALAVPALVAGYALLARKSWARTAGIVSAFLAALSFPFGTALCAYSLWFFFGKGRSFYESEAFRQSRSQLLPGADLFVARGGRTWEWREGRFRERADDYVPPPQPPDWRG